MDDLNQSNPDLPQSCKVYGTGFTSLRRSQSTKEVPCSILPMRPVRFHAN